MAADSGNARAMYAGIKASSGPTPIKMASLISKKVVVITDQAKQLERWVKNMMDAALDASQSPGHEGVGYSTLCRGTRKNH